MQAESIFWSGALFTDDDFSTIERDHMAIKCYIDAESERFLGCIAIGSHAAEIINLVSTAIATSQSAARSRISRPCIRAPQKLSSECCESILSGRLSSNSLTFMIALIFDQLATQFVQDYHPNDPSG